MTFQNEVLKSGAVVKFEFEAAKRSLICELMEREETNYALAIAVHPSKVPEIRAAFPNIEEATFRH
ncbi:hypothetical protein ANCDUO_19625 [Ancylostoma duodenale]|uniref:Uncharacterized protein n=1 Tax=Ancylostoma duodenale TaxID=51022 RepID=A0A0C2FUE1_9BILA|nr:hypothetical protein ANCDUO_19625 [Ancylostoma duodenale]